ncbi:trifunctional dihydropteroate synthetase [Xanthoria calcicola]
MLTRAGLPVRRLARTKDWLPHRRPDILAVSSGSNVRSIGMVVEANGQRVKYWRRSITGFELDTNVNYIRKAYLTIQFLPAITGVVLPSSQPDTNSTLCNIVRQEWRGRSSIPENAHGIARRVLTEIPEAHGTNVELRTHFPKALLNRMLSSDFKVESFDPLRLLDPKNAPIDTSITRWELKLAVHGISAPQTFRVNLSFTWPARTIDYNQHLSRTYASPPHYDCPYPTFRLHRMVADFMESKSHESLDVLAFEAAALFFGRSESFIGSSPLRTVAIRVENQWDLPEGSPRPNSNYKFDGEWYENFQRAQRAFIGGKARSTVFIALGSNIGNRVGMIEQACSEMARRGLTVRQTSSLYETEAMYKTDQQPFVNGACEIETTLPPLELLDQLKDIEDSLGRVKTVENGPRTIDLDILLYDNLIVNHDRLQIPHPRISEREFVLRPLCDLIPHSFLPQPSILVDFSVQLSLVPPSARPISPLTPLTRFAPTSSTSPSSQVLTADLPNRKTKLMAILNLTPDSFSRDGKHTPTFSPSSLLPQLHSLLHHQIPILDIGGQSTRPHASPLPAKEELARILPTIQFIRSKPAFNNILLSIDTYHSSVARACVEAGADIVNDVSGGLMDPEMFPTIADLGCTYILMHMRGNPETMNALTSYPDGVINGIATELNERVQKAMDAGIRRWRIILDPGIGFAKTGAQNIEVMRKFPELRQREGLKGLPWCVGVSRKRFIGKITGVPGDAAEERAVNEGSGPRYINTGDDKVKKKEAMGPQYSDAGSNSRTPPARNLDGDPTAPANETGPSYINSNDSKPPNASPTPQKTHQPPKPQPDTPTPPPSSPQTAPAPAHAPPDPEMQARIWGTAAAVTACVQGGADIVRVHDWEEMSKVVRMGDAVWRV